MLIHRHRLPVQPPAPLLILIHGWKGNENVMWAFESALPLNALIVSPRAPFEVEAGSYGWFFKKDDGTYEAAATGIEALHQFISELPALYPVDLNRIYLMGFSQGAALSFLYALAYPERVAGLVALAGFLPEGFAVPQNCLAGKPLLMMNGTEDETVTIAQARVTHEALKISGAEIDYREYEVGHKLNAQGMRELKQWLKAIMSV
jgi:phospholipase/carboxylesterase